MFILILIRFLLCFQLCKIVVGFILCLFNILFLLVYLSFFLLMSVLLTLLGLFKDLFCLQKFFISSFNQRIFFNFGRISFSLGFCFLFCRRFLLWLNLDRCRLRSARRFLAVLAIFLFLIVIFMSSRNLLNIGLFLGFL